MACGGFEADLLKTSTNDKALLKSGVGQKEGRRVIRRDAAI